VITNRMSGAWLLEMCRIEREPQLTDVELNAGQRAYDRMRARQIRDSAGFGPSSSPAGALEP
jgi:hypothetical protein